MIHLQNVSVMFGGTPIFTDLSWAIPDEEQRIGLVGPNGAGKSTLLRVITGDQEVESGRVDRGATTVGYLEQSLNEQPGDATVREAALQAFDEVLTLEAREKKITAQLERATDYESDSYAKLLDRLNRVQEQLNARDAHRIRSQTEATLAGLGFQPDDMERPLKSFSGGWRMRVALAKLLLQRPDVLLLDEPTNHLDIDSIAWLESYLDSYSGTVVLVSHDRYVLDRMVTQIAELTRGRLSLYDGSYSYYLEERKERRAQWKAEYENQQKRINEIEEFISRFRYNASKAAQVQSRIKKLEKMERIPPPPDAEDRISFRFPDPPRSGRVVLELSSFSKTYAGENGPVQVFDNAGPLAVERGDTIALVGPNGAGKSTLARMLRGTEAFEGERSEGHNVQLAHFAQHQADALPMDATIMQTVRGVSPSTPDTTLRTLLGAFLFTGDDVFKEIRVLSGGEKSRVALACTLLSPANVLILDEPTNHLDIQSKDVLIEAIQQYTGTCIIVSHDRYFLDEVSTHTWRVGNGDVRIFHGPYSEMQWQVEHGTAAALDPEPDASSNNSNGTASTAHETSESDTTPTNGTAPRPDDAFADLNSYEVRQKMEATEEKIMELEAQKEELESDMADPAALEDGAMRSLTKDYQALEAELAELYPTWEALTEHVMALEDA
ncbi:ABC transporter ATP-binding protein [Longimonas halophila]|uniref:ABC transporter ATP-binding protein n=1 Tax=Longimonas halophila TaxID=1469170 RepID=A0A2H3NRA0_9BACT|nr:ABC-F family ATP-binding cassette domain-containing protein [Longimonas halophila]PEN05981.1 ABC transporter ATP-binding protein [Longimonas halophila]